MYDERGNLVQYRDEGDDTVTCQRCRGRLATKIWMKRGYGHRLDGPAWRENICHGNTHVHKLAWIRNGRTHRTDGPAIIETTVINGKSTIRDMMWYIDGKLHREDGPAFTTIRRRFKKDITYESWFVDGKEFDIDKLEKYIALPFEEQVAIKLVFG